VGVRVVFARTGLRGVGKSQLAAAVARARLAQGWRVVAWLDASGREELLAGFAQLAVELGLADDSPDSAAAAGRVRHWLETGGEECLLVLDNASDADVLRPVLPAGGRAQVVVTSSRASLAALGVPVPVDVFAEGEAVAFLGERTGLADQQGALGLARELGCLPLALAQAAAVIAGQHLDYAIYAQRLATVTVADYLPRPEEGPYPDGTAQAITLALDAAHGDGPGGLTRRLLEVAGLLSPAGTSRTLLAAAAGREAAEVDAALQHAGAWSLVTWSVDQTTVVAHRLVMRVIREQAAADGTLAQAAQDAISGLHAMLPAADDVWRHPAVMQEFVTQATALAGHLDAFPSPLDGPAEQDMLNLLAWAGWYLNQISDISRAIPLSERTLTDRERVLGPDHPDTLRSRNNLADAYHEAGRLDDAIPLLEQTLADYARVLGPDHPDTLTSRNNLATTYQEAGRLDDAMALHQQTLADYARVLGPDHPDTLRSRNNLATTYQDAGRPDDAIPLLEQTLADYERVLGPDHPDTLRSRNNLATTYQDAGRLDDAIPLLEQTLADRERVLGPDHPSTLRSRNNLADAYQEAGRLDDAIPLLEQTLADAERLLGAKHSITLTVRANLRAAEHEL
jgi:tetratricopeptide (TPR) repeat protein